MRRALIAIVLLGSLLGPTAAAAPITAADFPSKASVKAKLDGRGQWQSASSRLTRTLGGRPRGCRSDRQMLDFDAARVKWYSGREEGFGPSITASAEIAVFRYPSVAAARDAVQRNASYPERCPRVIEWVCTDCDGISTTWRDRVEARQVGVQSVAWRYRRSDNLKHNGYCVVARDGRTVVRVEVGRTRTPLSSTFTYPPLRRLSDAVQVARSALRSAR